jgi:hypothetical protein
MNWSEVGLEKKDSSIVKWRRYRGHADRQINEDEHYYNEVSGFCFVYVTRTGWIELFIYLQQLLLSRYTIISLDTIPESNIRFCFLSTPSRQRRILQQRLAMHNQKLKQTSIYLPIPFFLPFLSLALCNLSFRLTFSFLSLLPSPCRSVPSFRSLSFFSSTSTIQSSSPFLFAPLYPHLGTHSPVPSS